MKYSLEYESFDVYNAGGFHPIPQEFVNNLIVGFVDFSSYRSMAIFQTSCTYETVSGQFGLKFPERITNPVRPHEGNFTVTRVKYALFYIKTWYCPDDTPLFDHTTQLCTICTIPDCKICFNVTYCGSCDFDNRFGLNTSTGQCDKCSLDNNVFLN